MKKNNAFSKILSLALVMTLMLTMVMSAFGVTASAEGNTVVTNRFLTNFEDGALFEGDEVSSDTRFTIESDIARGNYSLKHTGDDAGSTKNFTMKNFGTKVGSTYMITGYYYVADKGVDDYSWFSVWEVGGINQIKAIGGSAAGEWKQFNIEYTCTVENAPIRINVAKSTIYFDDIYVYEKSAYDSLPLTTDFSDAQNAKVLPVLPGVVSSEVNYEYNAELGKNVLVGAANALGSGWTSLFYIPYKLKAGVTYNLTVRYYSNIWMTNRPNGSTTSNFGTYDQNSWKTLNVDFTAKTDGETIHLSAPANTTTGKIYFDYIVLKEKSVNNNTASKQVYDFDNVNFSSNLLTSGIPKLSIAGDTFAYDYSFTSGTVIQSNNKLDFALTKGNVYTLSYDYKGAGAVRFIPNNGGWSQGMYSVEQNINNQNSNLTLPQSDSWATHTTTFVAGDNSTHLWIANYKKDAELYIDNVIIEDVTDKYNFDKYINDFEDESQRNLDEISPDFTEVTYESDETYGTVAKIDYSGTLSNGLRSVKIPFASLIEGETYRIKVIFKTTGWIGNVISNSTMLSVSGYGAPGVVMEDWKTQYFYYTPESDCYFGFGTNQSDVTMYVAEIAIEKVTGILGDLDNNAIVDSADLVIARKWFVGKTNGYEMFDYALDANEDDEIDLKDLVRMKRDIAGIGAPATVIVDECTNDVELYSSASNIYKRDNNSLFSDNSRYRVNTVGTESYIIYYAELGLREAVIGFDKSEKSTAEMTVYVSEDQSVWNEVTAKTVTTKPENDGSWISGAKYYTNLSGKYLKIVLPDSMSFAINKVYINGLNGESLSISGGQKQNLRKAATIYVSNEGDDNNSGFTPETAKATLKAATASALVPGDTIALACGDTFKGGAVLTASGTEDAPIKVTSYGEGAKPVITDFAGTNIVNGTGLLITGEYVEVSNLAFTDENGYSALDFYAYEEGATKGLKVENCYFYDINHTTLAKQDATGAIHFVAKGGKPTWFDGVEVLNNKFESVARTAIYFASEWTAVDKSQGWGNRNLALEDKSPYFAENIVVNGNTINNNGGDAIMLIGTKDALVEYNVASNTRLMADLGKENAFAVIWCHSSVGCVMQYNEVYGTTGDNSGGDLNSFDIDHACTDCIIQYNYSHSNEGAFAIVCGADGENDSMVSNSIIRYNVSVNDGLGNKRGAIDLSAGIDGVIFHNNTIIAKDTDRFFTIADYCDDGIYTAPKNIKFYNNLFYNANSNATAVTYGGDWNIADSVTVSFYNNVFRNVDNLPWSDAYLTYWSSPVQGNNITSADKLLKGIDTILNDATITNGINSVYETLMPVANSALINGGYDMSTVYTDFTSVDYAGNQYAGNIIGALNNGDIAVYYDVLTTGQTGALECTYSINTALNAMIIGTAGNYVLSTTDGKHVTWYHEKMQSFWLDGFISASDKASINNYYILQASSDNATWTDLTYTVTYSEGGNHQKCRLSVDSLPTGTKYVKLTKANGYNAWNKGSFVGVGYTYSK